MNPNNNRYMNNPFPNNGSGSVGVQNPPMFPQGVRGNQGNPAQAGEPAPNIFPQQFNKISNLISSPFGMAGIQMITNEVGSKTSFFSFLWASIFSNEIRYYFDVDNSYVLKKLLIVLCPFAFTGDWIKTVPEYSQAHQGFLAPRQEIHSPDLYIPLMSFLTCVLILCLSKGIGDEFQPSSIGYYLSYFLFISIFEILIAKLILFLLNIKNAGFLELLSHFSYKYIGLCVILALKLVLGNAVLYISKGYFLAAAVFFVYKTLKRYTASSMSEHLGIDKHKSKVLLILAGLDVIFMFIFYIFV